MGEQSPDLQLQMHELKLQHPWLVDCCWCGKPADCDCKGPQMENQ